VLAVDVVIITWNDGEVLVEAIASAIASSGVEVRLVVVDNGSSPPAEVDGVDMIRNSTNRGVAVARNQGARAGSNDYVCFLDSDARLHQESLLRLVQPLIEDETIGLAAPVFAGQEPGASAGRAPTFGRKVMRVLNVTSTYESTSTSSSGRWDIDFAIGACQLFRRTAFEAVGGLDESYFYGPEDVDFCLRLREAGWRLVQVADAPVEHPPRRRNRQLLTRRGLRHAWAVCRHLWRHRGFDRRVGKEGRRPHA